jgi:hypothetical protein
VVVRRDKNSAQTGIRFVQTAFDKVSRTNLKKIYGGQKSTYEGIIIFFFRGFDGAG